MPDYPEHDKLHAVADESQAQGDFLDWLTNSKGYHLVTYIDEDRLPRHVHRSPTDLLAEFHGISLTDLEKEKRAMLASLQTATTSRKEGGT